MMDKEKHKNRKGKLAGEHRKSAVFTGFKSFVPVGAIERLVNDAIRRYYSCGEDPIMVATNFFMDLVNIHPFEDGNGRIYRLILAHVLMRMKCYLFPVILSSFFGRGRRHYIKAVKSYYENPSMLYTMIAASLVHVWEKFEQNARMLS